MADTNSISPFTQTYSEIHENRILIRIRPASASSTAAASSGTSAAKSTTAASVSYWDSMSGGGFQRNITKRARPGQKFKAKVPGLGIEMNEITLKRAWNEHAEDRQPLEPLLGLWLSGKDTIVGFNLTIERVLLGEDGNLTLLDSYTGPVKSYEGPSGNTDSENFATETLVIDPSGYIAPDSMQPKTTTKN